MTNRRTIWLRIGIGALLLSIGMTLLIRAVRDHQVSPLLEMTLDEACSIIAEAIQPGMSVQEAIIAGNRLGVEMGSTLDDKMMLYGTTREEPGLLTLITRSIQMQIHFDESGKVKQIECSEVFTGL